MSKEKLEYCFKCDEPTGCAGKVDDSHYNEDGEGPFCWQCWCEDENPRLHEQVDKLESQLAHERKCDPFRMADAEAENTSLTKEIDRFKSQLAAYRWIPANEPPKEDGIYFVRRQDNTIPTARVFNDGMWHSHDTVLYWMHIPPLPEKGTKS